jgi:hypothetical protein
MNDLRKQIRQNIPAVRMEFIQVLQDMIGDM